MKVAAIIVNYNDIEDTEKYIKKISKYEIINKIVVVDNLSTNEGEFDKLKILESSKVKVVQSEKNGGYNYGNNFGIKYLENNGEEFDYYIISNPDIEVSENAIKHCLEVLETDSQNAVVAPRMFNKRNFFSFLFCLSFLLLSFILD